MERVKRVLYSPKRPNSFHFPAFRLEVHFALDAYLADEIELETEPAAVLFVQTVLVILALSGVSIVLQKPAAFQILVILHQAFHFVLPAPAYPPL